MGIDQQAGVQSPNDQAESGELERMSQAPASQANTSQPDACQTREPQPDAFQTREPQPDASQTSTQQAANAELRRRSPRPRAFAYAWGFAGLLFFGLGALGVALPILPTTPFMLLAAFCFARSSQKLDAWFRSTKLYRSVFESYVTRRTMTLKAKLKILIPVTVLLLISFILMKNVLIGRIVVAIVWVGHIVYFGFVVKTEQEGE